MEDVDVNILTVIVTVMEMHVFVLQTMENFSPILPLEQLRRWKHHRYLQILYQFKYSGLQAKVCMTFLALARLLCLFACSNAYDTHLGSHTRDVLPIGATEINVYGHSTQKNTNSCLSKKVWYSIVFSGVLASTCTGLGRIFVNMDLYMDLSILKIPIKSLSMVDKNFKTNIKSMSDNFQRLKSMLVWF